MVAKHKNGFMRLATVSIGIPISALAYAFPLYRFVLPRAIFTLFLIGMILEMHKLLPASLRPARLWQSLAAGLIFPACAWAVVFAPDFEPFVHAAGAALFTLIIIGFSLHVIFNDAADVTQKMSGLLFVAVYPGLLGSYYILIPNLTGSIIGLIAVTGMVYSNDGCAYLGGRFFGNMRERKRASALAAGGPADHQTDADIRKKALVKISPKKTATGFICGFIGGMIFFAIVYFMQKAWGTATVFPGGTLRLVAFACIINAAAMLGDLFESAVKRSANSKDSGTAMLGRGGTLDTFDSLLTASAAYFILYPLFFSDIFSGI